MKQKLLLLKHIVQILILLFSSLYIVLIAVWIRIISLWYILHGWPFNTILGCSQSSNTFGVMNRIWSEWRLTLLTLNQGWSSHILLLCIRLIEFFECTYIAIKSIPPKITNHALLPLAVILIHLSIQVVPKLICCPLKIRALAKVAHIMTFRWQILRFLIINVEFHLAWLATRIFILAILI